MSDYSSSGVTFACPSCSASWVQEGVVGGSGPFRYSFTIDRPLCPRCSESGVNLDRDGEEWGVAEIRRLVVRLSPQEREDAAGVMGRIVDEDADTVLDALAQVSPILNMIVDMARKQGSRKAILLALIVVLTWGVMPMATDARDAVNHQIEASVAELFSD